MILRYHGYAVALRAVRNTLGVSRDGLTALDLVDAARHYGLTARGYSVAPADLAHLTGPAVVHWQFNHFLVVERWSEAGVEVVDPSGGRRTMPAAEFDAGFTGVVMTFEPGPEFHPIEPPRRGRATDWMVGAVVLPHKQLWTQIVVASVALQVLGLALPIATQIVVDRVIPRDGRGILGILGVGLVVFTLCQFLLGFLRNCALASLRVRADADLTGHVVKHLLALPYSFFTQHGATDLVMRISGITMIREVIARNLLPTLLDGPLACGYLVLLLLGDPVLAACVMIVAGLQIGIVLRTRRRVCELADQELSAVTAAQGCLIETIEGIETLKSAGAEHRAHERWTGLFVEELNTAVRASVVTGLVDGALGSIRVVAPLLLLWVGAWRVLDGALSLGTMLGLTALGAAALAPLTNLATSLQVLQTASVYLDRLVDIIEAQPEPSANEPAPTLRGGIDVRQ